MAEGGVMMLMLALMGFSTVQGQTCIEKITECSQIMSNSALSLSSHISPPNIAALETECSSVRQSISSCESSARTLCSGQDEVLESLVALNQSLNQLCGQEMLCNLRAVTCQAPMLAVLPTAPPADDGSSGETSPIAMLEKMCPVYQQVNQCLQQLSATGECGNVEVVQNATRMISQASAGCAAISGNGVCPQSFTCFQSLVSTREGSQEQCGKMETVVQCLNGMKSTCNFDESRLTYANLETLLTSLCTEIGKFPADEMKMNCSAIEDCVNTDPSLGLAELSNIGSSSEDQGLSQAIMTAFSRMTDPAFLCGYMKVVAKCSVTHANTCGFSELFVASMTVHSTKLQQQCPAQATNDGTGATATNDGTGATDDGSGGAERTGHHMVHWVLVPMTVFSALLSLF